MDTAKRHSTKMDEVDVNARVEALVERRAFMSARNWKRAVAGFRSGFFGPHHKCLSFPVKLHMIASCASLDDIFWTDDGTSIAVNREGYKKNIMSVFFNQHTFRSLQSIMTFYGFETELGRFPQEVSHRYIVYSHPSFVRGRPDLSFKIHHPPKGSNGDRGTSAVPRRGEIAPKPAESDRKTNQRDSTSDEMPRLFCFSSVDSESLSPYEGMEGDANLQLPDEWDAASTSGRISLTQAEEKQLLRDLDIDLSPIASPRRDDVDVDCCSFKSLSTGCDSDDMSF